MQNATSSRFIFTILFIVFIALTCLITFMYIGNKSHLEQSQMQQIISTSSNKVENTLTRLLYKTQVLSALVIQNDGYITNFEQVASTILDDISIRNVLLAPKGIVTHVYPLAGNENVIGLDFFSESEGNKEAYLAKKSGVLILGGPFNLVQGGQALVGRLPVYIENNFWGLVSVTLNYPQALAGAELEQLKIQGFAYEIWRINPDTGQRQIIAHSNYEYNSNTRYVEAPLNVMNAQWYFRLAPIHRWYEYPETWIFIFLGIIISYLIASLSVHNRELRGMKENLEKLSYIDELTGILNRRGVLNSLKELCNIEQTSFMICYIDLTKFKQINDIYGHNTGDHILCRFTQLIKSHHTDYHLFGRIGGDEFLLVFKGDISPTSIADFWKKIKIECNNALIIENGKTLDILFSMGCASYPHDARTIDELINIADRNMYKEKKALYS